MKKLNIGSCIQEAMVDVTDLGATHKMVEQVCRRWTITHIFLKNNAFFCTLSCSGKKIKRCLSPTAVSSGVTAKKVAFSSSRVLLTPKEMYDPEKCETHTSLGTKVWNIVPFLSCLVERSGLSQSSTDLLKSSLCNVPRAWFRKFFTRVADPTQDKQAGTSILDLESTIHHWKPPHRGIWPFMLGAVVANL